MAISVDHVGIEASDYEKSKAFYAAALAPLGITIMQDYGVTVGMGDEFPFLWLSAGNPGHVHLAFRVADRATVDAFHAAAVAAGGTDNGKPGVRAEYHPTYYGAYVLDPDGHNIEAVCHVPA
jgi:catechol 2,3-dioxygenase-like lactoylglutathione lyase family enzyme